MPSKYRNVVAVLQQRQQCSKTHIAVGIELQRIAEEKAAFAEMEEIQCQVPPSVRSTFLTSFSPDSTKVASTHGDHKIYICDVRTGKLLHKLEGHQRTPWCLSFHPTSNDILASGCLAGEVRVWHLHGGSEKWQNAHSFVITSLAFHPLDQMLVIATANEIHFWDWSLPEPFATCSTNCPEEKVRFVKFDRLGTRLITGIAVLPEPYPGPSSIPSRSTYRSQPRPSHQPPQGLTSYRRNILTRLMNMYQHIENLEEASLGRRSLQTSAPAQEEALYRARHYAEATTQASQLQRQLQEQYAEQAANSSAATLSLSSDDGPTSEQRDLLDSHEEFLVRAFWRTFHRLRSICTTLERRMSHLQRNAESRTSAPDARPPTVPPYQQLFVPYETERMRSAPSNSTRNSQVPYWQVQYRITDILQRLANVTGYRARLTILRDQIFEVAERAQRRGGESYYVRRMDLAHCLWLVEMSLQLTQQMQRILHADYRITQLNINAQRGLTSNVASELSESLGNASRENSVPLRRNSAPDTSLQNDLAAIARDAMLEASMEFPSANNSYDASSVSGTRPSSSSSHSDSNSVPHNHSHSANPLRNCIVCGTRGATTDAGSSEEFDSAWERLRVVVRQELESLTERFRGTYFTDLNLLDLNDERTRVTRRLRNAPGSPASAASSEQRMSSHYASSTREQPRATNDASESGPSNQYEGLNSIFSGFQSYEAPNLLRNHPTSSNSSAPNQSSDTAHPANRISYRDILRDRLNRVPEIHIVPSSEDIEPSFLPPVHERPRSPPLSAILSGSNDPVLSTLAQSLEDTASRPRYESHGNIIHRIQSWDFSKYDIPSIKNTKANVVVRRCKIHNDASVDISSDGEMLVAMLPPSNESLMFAVFSLKPETLGQILLVSNFDSNAISLSFSPLSQYIVVGLATSRLSHSAMNKQAVAQIFELKYKGKTLVSSHIRSLTQDIVPTPPNHVPVSLNSVQWLPRPGEGLIYGTNRGCLRICKPICPMNGKVIKIVKSTILRSVEHSNFSPGMRYRIGSSPHRMFSASTQTMEAGTQTTGTQTTSGGDGRVR